MELHYAALWSRPRNKNGDLDRGHQLSKHGRFKPIKCLRSVIDLYFSALKNFTKSDLAPKGPSSGQLVVLPVVSVAQQLHHLFLQMFTDSAAENLLQACPLLEVVMRSN